MRFLRSVLLSISCAGGGILQAAEATDATKAANQLLLRTLPFDNVQDFELAKKGFIAPLQDNGVIKDSQGNIVWDLPEYDFAKGGKGSPDTVNPSLWRQLQLLMSTGLFKVCDRIYQVRGTDIANMTIVEGKTGIIVIDTLVSVETARAALELYYQNRPRKSVKAVIISHSHADHFGGIRGVVSQNHVHSGKVMIVAPKGFEEEALTENVLAGNAMGRRASYMYGNLIPKGPKGQASAGLGLTTSSGTVSFLPPSDIIDKPEQTMVIDGLTFQFMLAPATEAPAEMHFYIPELKALSVAENAVHNMHNIYTLRGAQIRSAKAWSEYLNKTRCRWGDSAEVLFGMHQWPVWGKEAIDKHLTLTADVYKYMHDQTLHLANQGFTKDQIGAMVKLPKVFQDYWSLRGYYGNTSQNVKSIYVYYLGWFDGNPAALNPLPPVEASKKYVEFMGGADAVMARARDSYSKGEYRWVAEVMNHVVFADPDNQDARDLEADAFEQLGYQAEAGPWRDFYLTGAQELRRGIQKKGAPGTLNADVISAMPIDMFFDYMAIELDGPKAENKTIAINWIFPDVRSKYLLTLRNCVLNYQEGVQDKNADAAITLDRAVLNQILLHQTTFLEKQKSEEIKIEGNIEKIRELLSLLDHFDFWFNIVTPQNIPEEKSQK
jgi:alkyl sulfatase BDS1-like metallo-beta-lactamase superfamily hydrolase